MIGFARIENKLGSVSAWMKKGNSMNYVLKDPSADPLKLVSEKPVSDIPIINPANLSASRLLKACSMCTPWALFTETSSL
jgi:hypothetical protein